MYRRAAIIMAALCFTVVAAAPAYAQEQKTNIDTAWMGGIGDVKYTAGDDMVSEEYADKVAAKARADANEEETKSDDAVKAAETEAQSSAETASQTEAQTAESETEDAASQTRSSTWTGAVLNSVAGTVTGPSGKETYYNLDMSQVVANMHARGYEGEYWVRDDGCKMFGKYIMCAANLSLRPFGTILESSLGTCMVCDTGGFASSNTTQIDIATNW